MTTSHFSSIWCLLPLSSTRLSSATSPPSGGVFFRPAPWNHNYSTNYEQTWHFVTDSLPMHAKTPSDMCYRKQKAGPDHRVTPKDNKRQLTPMNQRFRKSTNMWKLNHVNRLNWKQQSCFSPRSLRSENKTVFPHPLAATAVSFSYFLRVHYLFTMFLRKISLFACNKESCI